MERTDVLELMSTLKLYGMRAAYDEVMTTGIKRRHEPPRIVGDLLSAEIAEKQARSIKYQLTIPNLPLAIAPPIHCRPSDNPVSPRRSTRARRSPGWISAPTSPLHQPAHGRRSARLARLPGPRSSTPICGSLRH